MEEIDNGSATSTPRSSTTDGSGSTSSQGSSNYSFCQRKVKIPPDIKKLDAAMLEGPLMKRPVPQRLEPIHINNAHIEQEKRGIRGKREDSKTIIAEGKVKGDTVPRDIVPHPPVAEKPKTGVRRGSRKSTDTTPSPEVKDLGKNKHNESVVVSSHRKSSSDQNKNIFRKSDDEVSLINSYENYLRQLSKKEEESDGESDMDRSNNEQDDKSESDYDSDSSSYSISVSSLSSDEEEDDPATLTFSTNAIDGKEKFEPLYSLPLKPKNKDTLNSTANKSQLMDTSEHKYAVLNASIQSEELRTQSVPDLRTGKSFRTLDTLGYLCPKEIRQNLDLTQNISSPELKRETNFGLKYRPLPDIPVQKQHDRSPEKSKNDETIYEQIKTRDFADNSTSPAKSKVSFKAIADRVVSLMPRLTTKEARSKEIDRYMADIFRYLPDKTLRIFCGTWNMKGIKVVPETLDDYILPHDSEFIQDIYAIGCQEGTPFRKEWEIRLQETLGPTHVLMYSGNFGVLHLSIFIRRELVWFCTGIEQDTVANRIAHKIKTKGAIAVCFNVFGTSLLFINSHFASNQEKLKERVNDYKSICRSLTIPFGEGDNQNRDADVTSRFDRVFWFGDFNFRINKKRAETDEIFGKKDFDDETKRDQFIIEELKPHDQLGHLMEKGKIFHGFKEAPITFLPTYKFDVNTDNYDSSAKARVPSWTDRILYKSRQPDQIKVAAYSSCTTIKCSDHRPVFCVMEAKIEPLKKNLLLPVAMFDRDIYVEANMRRSAPKGSQQASNICTIL
ncbi:inositol polyphosphate 5-phosphatase OCRL-like [Rhopilema esculentum]|uniref:inositol polyphosphate 5-phosphatase OCRL-like n=1 Tax=Rhopilema esculentum TaxID=499914 RepID=UPI0031CF9DC9|eukprot:gene10790-19591_t